jgi:hypothetical protein
MAYVNELYLHLLPPLSGVAVLLLKKRRTI